MSSVKAALGMGSTQASYAMLPVDGSSAQVSARVPMGTRDTCAARTTEGAVHIATRHPGAHCHPHADAGCGVGRGGATTNTSTEVAGSNASGVGQQHCRRRC